MTDRYENRPKKKSILSRLLGLVRIYLISVGLFWTAIPIGIVASIFIYRSFFAPTESVDQSAVKVTKLGDSARLTLELSENLVDSSSISHHLLRAFQFGKHGYSATAVHRILRAALTDERIKEIDIILDGASIESSDILRWSIDIKKLRDAGKKTRLWSRNLSNLTALFSAHFDTVALPVSGSLEIPGPILSQLYFGPALTKLGIEFQVIRSGEFKSAFETLTRDSPSAPAKEMLMSVEKNIRNYFVEAIATARGLDPVKVRSYFAGGMLSPEDAQRVGLVTDVTYTLETTHKAEDGADPLQDVDGLDYLSEEVESLEEKQAASGDDTIGLIEASGEIVHGEPEGGLSDEEFVSVRSIREQVDHMLESDHVKAVVLRIDSPGGSAESADLMWYDLTRLAAKKPLIVSMGSVAASGGYYMAVPARKILAEPLTITGSIGVIAGLPSFQKMGQDYGFSVHTITGNEHESLHNPSLKLTDKDRELLTSHVKTTYDLFLRRVADGRKLTVEEVQSRAQGRVYSAFEAKELKLIDEVGGLDEAFTLAKTEGGLDPAKMYSIERFKDDSIDLSECLASAAKLYKCWKQINSRSSLTLESLITFRTPDHFFKGSLMGLEKAALELLRRYSQVSGLLSPSGESVPNNLRPVMWATPLKLAL